MRSLIHDKCKFLSLYKACIWLSLTISPCLHHVVEVALPILECNNADANTVVKATVTVVLIHQLRADYTVTIEVKAFAHFVENISFNESLVSWSKNSFALTLKQFSVRISRLPLPLCTLWITRAVIFSQQHAIRLVVNAL